MLSPFCLRINAALRYLIFAIALTLQLFADLAQADERSDYIRTHYTKYELKIPMRDGAKLFTSVYVPNDAKSDRSYPILLLRTPYSVGPYGIDLYKGTLGPSVEFEKSGYIFAFQDVRGRYMSEGEFVNMRPQIESKQGTQFDESSDTFDTIEWLIANIKHNNGRVGQWGISYPGFYASAGAIDSHPALKAVSPQAPIADWFFDDFHRNGAFVLPMGFNFFSSFGASRPGPTPIGAERFNHGTKDGYQFFLQLGPLQNVNKKYFNGRIAFWNEIAAHPNYDEFWQSRNLLPHLKNISASVLTVGGWYDTEDLYGPLQTYAAIEKMNPKAQNRIVMGPWSHGGWNSGDGAKLGSASFGFPTAKWFRDQVQFPFFEYHLKDQGTLGLAEATVFETGSNRWREFDAWPPTEGKPRKIHFATGGLLSEQSPATNPAAEAFDEFVSDPSKPVPYTMEITSAWAKDYMTEDQRFAAWRPDVLVYRGETLREDLTIAGSITADLWVSTSAGDADWIVKVIDEFPGEPLTGLKPNDPASEAYPSGRQQLLRAGVMRGRFREDLSTPKPFVPNQPTRVQIKLDDILHTFPVGHRLMIQIQSTWFPFIDRNPQKFVENIFDAKEADFIKANHRLYRSPDHPSRIEFSVLVP
jgi:putative CocE/NonD family hydrolase